MRPDSTSWSAGCGGRSGALDGHQEAAITLTLPAGLLPASDATRPPAVLPHPPLPDLVGDVGSAVGGFVGDRVTDAVESLLRALSSDFLDQLAAPVSEYVLHTPDLLVEASLRRFWLVALAVLTATVAVPVAIAGVALATGSQSRLGLLARESLGVRLPGCLLTAAISLPLVALEVDLANRMVDAFVAEGFSSGNNPLWTALGQAVHGDAAAGLAIVVTTAVGVVLLVVLVVLALARWATLWLLVVLAPIAMGFALLPGGSGVTRLWWRLQLATVFLPVANAVLLGTYVAMFTSERSGLVGALAGVAVLALMTKLPGWAAGHAADVHAHELTSRIRRATASPRRAAAGVIGGATPSRSRTAANSAPDFATRRPSPQPPAGPRAGVHPPQGSPARGS
jgi:hypothetical protein